MEVPAGGAAGTAAAPATGTAPAGAVACSTAAAGVGTGGANTVMGKETGTDLPSNTGSLLRASEAETQLCAAALAPLTLMLLALPSGSASNVRPMDGGPPPP